MTMQNTIPWPLEDLVPHAEPMILIDDVLDVADDTLTSRVQIGEDCIFYSDFKGVPALVGVEYMAQTIAVLAGVRAKKAGRPVRVGFLVGTRRYTCSVPVFVLGQVLDVHVREVFEDGGIGVFDCEIWSDTAEVLASARLNVYLPPVVTE